MILALERLRQRPLRCLEGSTRGEELSLKVGVVVPELPQADGTSQDERHTNDHRQRGQQGRRVPDRKELDEFSHRSPTERVKAHVHWTLRTHHATGCARISHGHGS